MVSTEQVRIAFAIVFSAALVTASWSDVRQRRVANWLCLGLLTMGLVAGILGASAGSFSAALLGALLGLVIWLPFWLMGLLGAGDVKFFAAASSWIGPSLAWRASLGAALLGGVLAVLFMMQQRGIRSTVEFGALSTSNAKAIISHAAGETASASVRTFPYAVPMAIVIAFARFWPLLFF